MSELKKVNIFKILKTNKPDIRHSKFLEWLLNPYASHNLNGKFLYLFLSEFFKRNQDIKNIQDWMLLDMTTAEVVRVEYYKNKNKYLNIVIEFSNANKVIAIENKTFSKENKKNNSSRTILYRQNIEEKFKGYDCLFIYLTPLGDFPDDDKWGAMTYTQIIDIVSNIIDNYIDNSYIKLLLENYIEILGDRIVENKIYRKHKNIEQKIMNVLRKENNLQ